MTEATEELPIVYQAHAVALSEALSECSSVGFESEGDYRGGGYVAEFDEDKALTLITEHDKRTLAARDDEWQIAYHGTPGFGPKSPAELRVFVEEASAVNAEVAEHWKNLVLSFAKRLDGIYEKNAAREQHGKQDYNQIHLGGRQTEIATIAAELRALANANTGSSIDPRPTCIHCGERWLPPEGVDATTAPCGACLWSAICVGEVVIMTDLREDPGPLRVVAISDQGVAKLATLDGKTWGHRSTWGGGMMRLKESRINVRPVVLWFAEQMELALRANDHKGGWHNDFPENLYYRIVDESDELHAALHVEDENEASVPPDPKRITREAADVANMAMMVADHFRDGGPSKDQGVTLHVAKGAEENEDRG